MAVDKTVPIYKSPPVGIIYVAKRIKDNDVLIGSHYIFVKPEGGDFVSDYSPRECDDLNLDGVRVLEAKDSETDKRRILSVNFRNGFLKRTR